MPIAGLIAVVAVPVAVAFGRLASAGWVPTSDDATVVTRSYDVWSRHPPLTGAFSLAGSGAGRQVFSLGPMLFWLLGPAARWGPPWSLPLTMAVWSVTCFGVALVAARRIAGWPFAVVVAAGLLLVVRACGARQFVEVWNPWAGIAPFVAVVLVCWLVALGHRRWFAVAVVFGSFAAQAHLTFLAPTIAALVVAVIGGWWPDGDRSRTGTGDLRSGRGGPAAGAIGVGLACWSAPLYQQFRGPSGNLAAAMATATSPGATFGPSVGVNVLWRSVGVPPRFVHTPPAAGREALDLVAHASPFAWAGSAALVAALVLVLLRARRCSCREVAVGAVLALVLSASIVATAARTPADRVFIVAYVFRWMAVVGMVGWVVAALAAARLLAPARLVALRRMLSPVAVGLAVAVLVLAASIPPRSEAADGAYGPATRAGHQLMSITRPGDRVLLTESGRYEVTFAPALAWTMRRSGRHPVLARDLQVATGTAYARTGRRCDLVVELRSAQREAPGGLHRVLVLAVDRPGVPPRMAIDVGPDRSPAGRC